VFVGTKPDAHAPRRGPAERATGGRTQKVKNLRGPWTKEKKSHETWTGHSKEKEGEIAGRKNISGRRRFGLQLNGEGK